MNSRQNKSVSKRTEHHFNVEIVVCITTQNQQCEDITTQNQQCEDMEFEEMNNIKPTNTCKNVVRNGSVWLYGV